MCRIVDVEGRAEGDQDATGVDARLFGALQDRVKLIDLEASGAR